MSNRKKRLRLWKTNPYCFVCEQIIEDFTESSIEHIIPLSKGGTNFIDNLSISHKSCNVLKADLVDVNEWKRKVRVQNEINKRILWFGHRSDHHIKILIQSSFFDAASIIKTLEKFPRYYVPTPLAKDQLQIQIKYLRKLRQISQLEDIIEASRQLENYRTGRYWKIIFGLVFIEHYLLSQDVMAIIHGIWRISSYQPDNSNLILFDYSRTLLEFCHSLSPEAYESYRRCLMESTANHM